MDTDGNVIQSLESDTIVDTASPVISAGVSKKLKQTDIELELERQIKKQLPIEEKPIDIKIITPDDAPPYIRGGGGGGGNNNRTMPGRFNDGQVDGPLVQDYQK
jgi:hypothetical protein